MIVWGNEPGPWRWRDARAGVFWFVVVIGLTWLAFGPVLDAEQAIAERRERPRIERLREVLADWSDRP